jgi:hypothetical protein
MLFVATLTSSKDIKARESRCPWGKLHSVAEL